MLLTCNPIYELLCKYRVFNRNVSAVLSILFINLLVFFIVFSTGKVFINKLTFLLTENYSDLVREVKGIIYNINNFLRIDFLNITDEIKDFSSKISYNSYIRKGAMYTTQGIFAYFISNIAVYFILVDKYVIVKAVEKLLPNKNLHSIKTKIKEINNIFKIELILILTTAVVTFLGLVALNIKNAFLLSVICGLLDLLPYIGTIIVFIPLIIYNIIIDQKIIAFGLILLYLLLQVTRQIAETKFVSNKLKVHPLILVLGIYIGITSFGFIGLFMVPLFIIVTKEIILST
jgi:predicted PurR-regulated permease PerM